LQAWDRYAGMNNNPVRYNDPSGHNVDCAIGEHGCQAGKLSKVGISDLYEDTYDLSFTKNDPRTWKSEQWKIWNNMQTELTASDTPGIENNAVLWGWNGSASGSGPYLSGGQEEIVILDDGTRATYNYMGDGDSHGAGASTTAYIGIATNVINPESYKGNAATVGVTVSVADIGMTVAYFWNTDSPPLTPGNTQGFYIGYSPGAQFSIWRSNAVYDLTWASR
jgi:hypothetical protein